ncbi:MAG: endolytic transglycosylase MltG [bacterium]|nr:endolytic transglycosylase MltG [bacterium]
MRRLKIFLALIIVSALIGLGGQQMYLWGIGRPSVSGEAQKIVIQQGEGTSAVAERLYQAKLINSATLFKIYTRLSGLGANIQAGEYAILGGLNLKEVVSLLQHGTFDTKATFLEGWRREEMAEYLAKVMKRPELKDEFLQESVGLEGYLFPDTYAFPAEIQAVEVVAKLRENFDKRVTSALRQDLARAGFSLNQAVIFASLVEREVKNDEDRPEVAAILVKRWRADWPLEVDATVQYALASIGIKPSQADWWPKTLSADDLKIDSLYNTRLHKGLPPAPICNPGLRSLEGLTKMPETTNWFYLSDKEEKMHYAQTLEEHNALIEKYLNP